jgi:hypothetical protein
LQELTSADLKLVFRDFCDLMQIVMGALNGVLRAVLTVFTGEYRSHLG